jgi:hypothetical protein
MASRWTQLCRFDFKRRPERNGELTDNTDGVVGRSRHEAHGTVRRPSLLLRSLVLHVRHTLSRSGAISTTHNTTRNRPVGVAKGHSTRAATRPTPTTARSDMAAQFGCKRQTEASWRSTPTGVSSNCRHPIEKTRARCSRCSHRTHYSHHAASRTCLVKSSAFSSWGLRQSTLTTTCSTPTRRGRTVHLRRLVTRSFATSYSMEISRAREREYATTSRRQFGAFDERPRQRRRGHDQRYWRRACWYSYDSATGRCIMRRSGSPRKSTRQSRRPQWSSAAPRLRTRPPSSRLGQRRSRTCGSSKMTSRRSIRTRS